MYVNYMLYIIKIDDIIFLFFTDCDCHNMTTTHPYCLLVLILVYSSVNGQIKVLYESSDDTSYSDAILTIQITLRNDFGPPPIPIFPPPAKKRRLHEN